MFLKKFIISMLRKFRARLQKFVFKSVLFKYVWQKIRLPEIELCLNDLRDI